MSLLQNEEFVIYQLRSSYLSSIKDGVGERLINVNSSVLNNPSFRACGWQSNASDIRRTYSPPIPTAVTAPQYFQPPQPSNSALGGIYGNGEGMDEEGGLGMVTGGGSNETVGPSLGVRRRRRKEAIHMDDSSDLSEDSDDDDSRPAQQIQFTKMPLRSRAGSSPMRTVTIPDGPSLMVTSPSRPSETSHLAAGSIRNLEQITRPRRDTTTTATSSDLSSDPEMDQAFVQRKPISSRRARATLLLTERIQEDEREGDQDLLDEDPGAASDTTISSAFVASVDSLAAQALGHGALGDSLRKLPGMSKAPAPVRTSPKKQRGYPSTLQVLPGPRPISIAPTVSLLGKALQASNNQPDDPLLKFATMSGKDSSNPFYIKILAPSSKLGSKPFEMLLRRPNEGEKPFTVAAVIGFTLWRYNEENVEPKLTGERNNVNYWNFRMVEDGEVDYDFPALARTASMMDFTSRNNRGASRARSREKPWDEFALVEANEREFRENETATPKYSEEWASAQKAKDTGPILNSVEATYPVAYPLNEKPRLEDPGPFYDNPIIGVFFHSDIYRNKRNKTLASGPGHLPMDAPAAGTGKSRSRTALKKTLNVRYVSEKDLVARTTLVEVTTDTYLAEVLEQACKRLNISEEDREKYVLRVAGTTQVVPEDRTVEALGEMADLDLQRRRLFVGADGTVVPVGGILGFPASPKSESPNAPIIVGGQDVRKGKSGKSTANATANNSLARYDTFGIASTGSAIKRYNVVRKQPMSFATSSAKIIMLEAEFMHIMPSVGAKAAWEVGPGKSTTIPFGSVIGCKVSRKHPRMFRVTVFKEREQKRYDFEAASADEAVEIVEEIRKGVEGSKPTEGVY